jgi:hypothetical protein
LFLRSARLRFADKGIIKLWTNESKGTIIERQGVGYPIGAVTAWVAARSKHSRSDVKRLDGLVGFPPIAARLQSGWKVLKDPNTLFDIDSQAENE